MNETLSTLIELYGTQREKRLLAQKEVDKLEKEEKVLQSHITRILEDDKLQGEVITDNFKVFVDRGQKPVATDWNALSDYIVKHKAVDLLQRRLTESAVFARWGDGIQIPGITPTDTTTFKINRKP